MNKILKICLNEIDHPGDSKLGHDYLKLGHYDDLKLGHHCD